MNEVYTLLFLFMLSGILGYKVLETMLDPPTAFLISMVFTTLLCVGTVKLKEGISFDTTFSSLLLDGNTSIGPNNYENEGGSYYDRYLGRWVENNSNRAFIRFRDLNVKSGRVYGNVASNR